MAINGTSGSDLLRCDLGLPSADEINGFGGDDASGSEETTRFVGGSGAERFQGGTSLGSFGVP
jgi:hypothetical protein